jgi:demethylmenaquinone methyltransferase/2-methoxy-6-polyprenyl-1,4-benzoquinol methylase
MTHLSGPARAAYVQSMFARIAERYDLMNRLMTAGQDMAWRKIAIDEAALPKGGRLLDLGTGTGDLAFEAVRRDPSLTAVGGDFTLEMMRVGQRRAGGDRVCWAGLDALHLPFPDHAFDAVTSGYLMRNVIDVRRAWAEQYRVLKPGGWAVCLDTTPPPRSALRPTENFLTAEHLAETMTEAGFRETRFRRLMFGAMAIHWGRK